MSFGSDGALVAQRQAEYLAEQEAEITKAPAVRLAVPVPVPGQLTFWKVALAVFVGNLMFAIVAGIIYGIAHS